MIFLFIVHMNCLFSMEGEVDLYALIYMLCLKAFITKKHLSLIQIINMNSRLRQTDTFCY